MAFITNYNAQDDKTETTGSTTGDNVAPIISSGIAPDESDVQPDTLPGQEFSKLSSYLSTAQNPNDAGTDNMQQPTNISVQQTPIYNSTPTAMNFNAGNAQSTIHPQYNSQPIIQPQQPIQHANNGIWNNGVTHPAQHMIQNPNAVGVSPEYQRMANYVRNQRQLGIK